MWLRRHKASPGSAVGPYGWDHDGAVTEVPDELGGDLLALGGYSVAEPPKAPEPVKAPEPEPVKAVRPAARHGKPGSEET